MLGDVQDPDLESRMPAITTPSIEKTPACTTTGAHHGTTNTTLSSSSSSTALETDRIADAQDLITLVASTLITHGGPSHRIQPVIEALGAALDTPTIVYPMNTHTILSFPPHSKRGPPTVYPINKKGSMNFTKLPHVFKLVKSMIRAPSKITFEEVRAEIGRIDAMVNMWGELAIAASYIPAAVTSAIMFFGGDWKDAGMSGVLAVIPAGLFLVADKFERFWWIYEVISCFLISLIATALSKHFCYSTLILSAPVSLLPGYTVSISVVEIMTKNTVAGCIRLCYTVVYLCCMVLGLTLAPMLYNAPGNMSGIGFGRMPVDIGETCSSTRGIVVNPLWLLLCVPVYVCAYNVYLKTPYRQWPMMIVVGSLGYGAGYMTKHVWHAPPEINAFVASLTLGFFANLYARITDDFAFNGIVAGVFIQVPGSWGIRGLLSFAYGDYDKGIYWNYSMLAICVAISTALIISNHVFFGFNLLNRGAPHMDF